MFREINTHDVDTRSRNRRDASNETLFRNRRWDKHDRVQNGKVVPTSNEILSQSSNRVRNRRWDKNGRWSRKNLRYQRVQSGKDNCLLSSNSRHCPRFKKAQFDENRDSFVLLESCSGKLIIVDLLLMEMKTIRGLTSLIDFSLEPPQKDGDQIIYYLTRSSTGIRLWRANILLGRKPAVRTETRKQLCMIQSGTTEKISLATEYLWLSNSISIRRIFVYSISYNGQPSVVEVAIKRETDFVKTVYNCGEVDTRKTRNAIVLSFFYQQQFGVTTTLLQSTDNSLFTLDAHVGHYNQSLRNNTQCILRKQNVYGLNYGRTDVIVKNLWLVTSVIRSCHSKKNRTNFFKIRFDLTSLFDKQSWLVSVENSGAARVRDIVVRPEMLNLGLSGVDLAYVIDSRSNSNSNKTCTLKSANTTYTLNTKQPRLLFTEEPISNSNSFKNVSFVNCEFQTNQEFSTPFNDATEKLHITEQVLNKDDIYGQANKTVRKEYESNVEESRQLRQLENKTTTKNPSNKTNRSDLQKYEMNGQIENKVTSKNHEERFYSNDTSLRTTNDDSNEIVELNKTTSVVPNTTTSKSTNEMFFLDKTWYIANQVTTNTSHNNTANNTANNTINDKSLWWRSILLRSKQNLLTLGIRKKIEDSESSLKSFSTMVPLVKLVHEERVSTLSTTLGIKIDSEIPSSTPVHQDKQVHEEIGSTQK